MLAIARAFRFAQYPRPAGDKVGGRLAARVAPKVLGYWRQRFENDWEGRHPVALRRGSASREVAITNGASSVDGCFAGSHFVAQGDSMSPLPVIPPLLVE